MKRCSMISTLISNAGSREVQTKRRYHYIPTGIPAKIKRLTISSVDKM